MAKANPFRFSTKYQDDETELLYYGYRYYNASTGRWLSRDRIKDATNHNLYCLVGNNPLNKVDVLGLAQGDFRWREPNEVPKDGPPQGVTIWAWFNPQATIKKDSQGCCHSVHLSGGYAMAQITYAPGTSFGIDVLTHERDHVRLQMKPAYEDYKKAAYQIGRPCLTVPQANCIKNVIEGELALEYKARSRFEGEEYDWNTYGPYLSATAWLWDLVQKRRDEYYNAVDVMTRAVANCRSL